VRVLITGGSGRIGRYAVREFAGAGHAVTAADIVLVRHEGTASLRVDLIDAGQVYQALAMARAEAVVHLGAWANDDIVPNSTTYGDNVRGTYNVFQACADLRIRRVVSASSAQVYGMASAAPLYLPLDEGHPARPDNPYALSKVVGEQAADYFATRTGLTILSFRFMGVRAPEEMDAHVRAMAANPAAGARLLWTLTDARDAALACRLAVEADDVASGPYNITGANVVVDEDTSTLVARHFGPNTDVRAPLAGRASPMSCARAEAAFGYRPRHHPSAE
jgi:nucleoside-diphosphate-sugar epimerase